MHTAVLRVKNGESLCVVINIRSVRYTKGRHIGALAYKHLDALHHSLIIHDLGMRLPFHVTYNICPWAGSFFKCQYSSLGLMDTKTFMIPPLPCVCLPSVHLTLIHTKISRAFIQSSYSHADGLGMRL